MKSVVLQLIVLTHLHVLDARLNACPEVLLPKWDDFDFLKSQGGTWYLTHMTNFEIGKDIDESIGCSNKIVVIGDDYKSLNYISMGFPQLKDVTQFNLTANIDVNPDEKRNFTLQFLGDISWKIGPVYILEGDSSSYTLHWQCFILNNQRVENFLLYSRTPNVKNDLVEGIRKKLVTYVPKGTGSLDPLIRCSRS